MSLSRILMSSVEESTQPEVVTNEEQSKQSESILDESFDLVLGYDHEIGARLIAMETAEELHDIFLESFYGAEQADILAIREGVALEGSQYEVIVEGLARDAFEKIKTTLQNIWTKTVNFFKSVIRFIEQFTLSGKEFFNKYNEQFRELKGLNGFRYKMYDYDDNAMEGACSEFVDLSSKLCRDQLDNVSTLITYSVDTDGKVDESESAGQGLDTLINNMKKVLDEESMYTTISKGSAKNSKEFNQFLFGLYRNGAKGPEDKKELEISDVYSKIQVVRNFKPDSVKKIKQITDDIFSEATHAIDQVNVSLKNAGGVNANRASEFCRILVSILSKTQSIINTSVSVWKNAVKERDSEYKGMAMAALKYARKNK